MIPDGEVEVTINEVTETVTVNLTESVSSTVVDVDIDVTETQQPITIEVSEMGLEGASAYEVWLAEGNVGTEQDFLDSLKPFNLTISATPPVTPSVNDLWIEDNT